MPGAVVQVIPWQWEGARCYPHLLEHFCLAPSKTLEPLGTAESLSKDIYGPLRLYGAQAEAQHAGRHEPCELMLATGREKVSGEGYYVKDNHPEGQPLPTLPGVQLNIPSSFLAHPLQGVGVRGQTQRDRGGGAIGFRYSFSFGQQDSKTHLSTGLATHSFFVS